MKILVVGDGHSAIHEVAVVAAFKKLGHEVESFYWQDYFKSSNPIGQLWRRAQNKFVTT
jgi:spore maturation protein CgeB